MVLTLSTVMTKVSHRFTDRGDGQNKEPQGTLRIYSPWCQHQDGGKTFDFVDIQSCNQIETWIESFSTAPGVPSMS